MVDNIVSPSTSAIVHGGGSVTTASIVEPSTTPELDTTIDDNSSSVNGGGGTSSDSSSSNTIYSDNPLTLEEVTENLNVSASLKTEESITEKLFVYTEADIPEVACPTLKLPSGFNVIKIYISATTNSLDDVLYTPSIGNISNGIVWFERECTSSSLYITYIKVDSNKKYNISVGVSPITIGSFITSLAIAFVYGTEINEHADEANVYDNNMMTAS